MATNKRATFWQFLSQYKIEIPIIQRDYAQGRSGKESLRKNFLNDLKESLENTDKKEKRVRNEIRLFSEFFDRQPQSHTALLYQNGQKTDDFKQLKHRFFS